MEFKNMGINRVKFEREEDLHLTIIEGLAGSVAFGIAVYIMFIVFGA